MIRQWELAYQINKLTSEEDGEIHNFRSFKIEESVEIW